MSGTVSLRVFHTRDLEDVHSLVTRTIDESYPPFYTPLVIDFFKKYHQKGNLVYGGYNQTYIGGKDTYNRRTWKARYMCYVGGVI
jgi:hypothetical protein